MPHFQKIPTEAGEMPLYQYHCVTCDTEIEQLKKVAEMDDFPECPCGKDSLMKRTIFTTGLKITGKGVYSPGFHVSSSRKK